jgi:predicted NAD/FAD-binding protein
MTASSSTRDVAMAGAGFAGLSAARAAAVLANLTGGGSAANREAALSG